MSEPIPPTAPPATVPAGKLEGQGKGIKIGIAIIVVIAIVVVASLLSGLGGIIKKEPRWLSVKLLHNSDDSYDFFIALLDENENEITGLEGTGHLTITCDSEILYDSDFRIGSRDYTRKMPGFGSQPTCAFVRIPAGAVKKSSDEWAIMGRARVDFTTSGGTAFEALEWDVVVP